MTNIPDNPTFIGLDLASKPDSTVLRLPCGTVLRDEEIWTWQRQQSAEEVARVFGIPSERLS